MTSRSCLILAGLMTVLLTAGCLRLERERPEKRHYLIEVAREEHEPDASPAGGVVQVRRFDVSPAFEASSFIYRTGGSSWESDYYNAFFVSPDVMITGQVARWLENAGLFTRVSTGGSQVRPDYLLEGNVVTLHGDYRDPARPVAVIELQLLLLLDRVGETEMVFQGDYSGREPVPGNSPQDLVVAWRDALKSILRDAELDLAEALDAASAPGS